jgi:hypothetical protein
VPGTTGPAPVICYKDKRTFAFAGPITPVIVGAALQVELSCEDFVPYRPGKSPKEHEEMTVIEQVRAETRAFQEAADRTAERRHQENLNWQKQVEENVASRFGRGWLYQLALAVIGGIIALIGARFIPWFHLSQ